MKLNKVLALALSGVMAVSMLAGCKGGSANGGQDDSSSKPAVTTGAAAIMNTYLDKYEFTSSTEQANYLAQALKEFTYEDVKAATTAAPGALGDGVAEGAYTVLSRIMRGEAGLKNTLTGAAFTPVKGKANSLTFLFEVEADGMNENSVLYLIAGSLKAITTNDVVTPVGATDSFNAEYTGDVSMEKVEKSDADGKNTHSAYVVLVTLTQTVGSDKVTHS